MSYNEQDQKKLTISAIFAGIASGFLLAFLVLFMVRFMEFKTIHFVLLAVVVTAFPMCFTFLTKKGLNPFLIRSLCIVVSLVITCIYAYEAGATPTTVTYLISRFVILHGVSLIVNMLSLFMQAKDSKRNDA